MKIKIQSKQTKNISDSIGEYIYMEVKTKEDVKIEWLARLTGFYQMLNDLSPSSDYVFLDVEKELAKDLCIIIEKHIIGEIKKTDKKEKSWLFEMMSLYLQLKDNKSDTKDNTGDIIRNADNVEDDKSPDCEIGENYDSSNMFVIKDHSGNEDVSPYEVYEPEEEDEIIYS